MGPKKKNQNTGKEVDNVLNGSKLKFEFIKTMEEEDLPGEKKLIISEQLKKTDLKNYPAYFSWVIRTLTKELAGTHELLEDKTKKLELAKEEIKKLLNHLSPPINEE